MLRSLDVRYVVVHLDQYGSDAPRVVAALDARPEFRLLMDERTTRLYEIVAPPAAR